MNDSSKISKLSSQAVTRRQFIKHAAGTAGALALSGSAFAQLAKSKDSPLPKPQKSGIEHIVVVMMENRSFDHFLGWLPGANGKQNGLVYKDAAGLAHSTFPLAPDYQGCDHPIPDHSYQGGRVEYNNGACDGWLRAGSNDLYSIGYYNQSDLSFLGNAAPAWTTFDNYFAAIMAETYPNRVYQHAAQTDRLTNTLAISNLPTIWDRLAAEGLKGRYYFSDIPILALWGTKYLPICRPLSAFLADCAAGTLPQVSFVDPSFLRETQGLSNDDHPYADIRNGEAFLNTVYNAVTTSPNWPNTVMVINYDEWGGFFDHVAPSAAPIPPADRAAGNQDGLRGFRVPALVISPWSRRANVAHGLYDHTSVLKMIEWRWHLQPLTVRDANANNLAEALDFSRTNIGVPRFTVPTGPFGSACGLTTPTVPNEMDALATLAKTLGFKTL
ncbi:MAG: phospholipase [Pedosphaera sp.]|nr:phospholipase [Pedosphaera sp.]